MFRTNRFTMAGFAIAWTTLQPAFAHHSYAMFDRDKTVTVSGVIAKLDWRNPHVYIWLYVKNQATGNQDIYAVETGSTLSLGRRGWDQRTFQPGDKVTISLNPLRAGGTGGYFVKATKEDGTVVSGDGAVQNSGGESVAPGAASPGKE